MSVSGAIPGPSAARTARLWVEFTLLFVATPLAMAFALEPNAAFQLLGIMTLIGVALLAITPGWRWGRLLEGGVSRWWRETLAFFLVTVLGVAAVTLWLVPGRFLALPTYAPGLWLTILALYPIFSVLPQELLYRPLFFERYGALFPNPSVAIAVNAACFGLAHLFFFNWPAVLMTAIGGAAFGWAYAARGSFGLAVLWHALAGQAIFTFGLGIYFYHGAIPSG